MKDAHDSILQKALPLKFTEILNALIVVSSFLNLVYLSALQFHFTKQAYVQGAKWK